MKANILILKRQNAALKIFVALLKACHHTVEDVDALQQIASKAA